MSRPQNILIRGFSGLGDNLYQFPFIILKLMEDRENVYWLRTPWPQLYLDAVAQLHNLRLLPIHENLWTQEKNVERSRVLYNHDAPQEFDSTIRLSYTADDIKWSSITSTFERQIGSARAPYGRADIWAAFQYLPDVSELAPSHFPLMGEKFALIRPLTMRSEWMNSSRACDPFYIEQAASWLKAAGVKLVAVADTRPDKEWIEGYLPAMDAVYVNGEMNLYNLMWLMQNAVVTVGAVGWIVPVGLSLGARTFFIQGGQGGINCAEKIVDPRFPGFERMGWATPDKLCRCIEQEHDCNKTISDFGDQWLRYINTSGISRLF